MFDKVFQFIYFLVGISCQIYIRLKMLEEKILRKTFRVHAKRKREVSSIYRMLVAQKVSVMTINYVALSKGKRKSDFNFITTKHLGIEANLIGILMNRSNFIKIKPVYMMKIK